MNDFSKFSEEELRAYIANHNVPPSRLKEIVNALEEAARLRREDKLRFFTPYSKQKEFFDLGARYRQRVFLAGNKVGKTYAGAFEIACHLTGLYPQWWQGKRFNHPVKIWAAGTTSLAVRDTIQEHLCGKAGVVSDFGSGLIPKKCFVDTPSLARGITDAYDTLFVRHRTDGVDDGVSTLSFKSYEQGRAKFQGAFIDVGWCDEDPEDERLYQEFLTRLTGPGIMMVTFTPLAFATAKEFVDKLRSDPSCAIVSMSLDDPDIRHFTREEIEARKASYLPHEREARIHGIPYAGSGRIFTTPEEDLKINPFPVPPHWAKIWGIDFGMEHPFAAALLAIDRDTDTIYVIDGFKQSGKLIIQDAERMKNIAVNPPVAWPHDGNQRDKKLGEPVAMLYKSYGLKMLPHHAKFPSGSVSVEEGIMEMDHYMKNGKFKVFSHLSPWFDEYRGYYRDDKGNIVKKFDDLLCATRYAMMMRRFAQPVSLGPNKEQRVRFLAPRPDVDWLFPTYEPEPDERKIKWQPSSKP